MKLMHNPAACYCFSLFSENTNILIFKSFVTGLLHKKIHHKKIYRLIIRLHGKSNNISQGKKTADKVGSRELSWENRTKSLYTWHTQNGNICTGKIDTEGVLNIDLCSTGKKIIKWDSHAPNSFIVCCLPAPARRAWIVSSSESIHLTSPHPLEEAGIPAAPMTAILWRNPVLGFFSLAFKQTLDLN